MLKYQEIVGRLTNDELDQVINATITQNNIEELVSCECNCESIDKLHKDIQQPIKNIFEFAFNLLTELDIRDHQYEAIFDRLPYNICPFCGCEYFEDPKAPRQDLDHYLAESKYPFAGITLRNLVPMGHLCNSHYKQATDILFKIDGVTRRKSHYPYRDTHVRISVNDSRLFAGDDGIFSPQHWQIDFDPNNEEVRTWDEVFHIRERYIRDFLNKEYKSWLGDFMAWGRSATINAGNFEDVQNITDRYVIYLESLGLNDRAFLKAAVFRFLASECRNGNQRVKDILSSLVFGISYFVHH